MHLHSGTHLKSTVVFVCFDFLLKQLKNYRYCMPDNLSMHIQRYSTIHQNSSKLEISLHSVEVLSEQKLAVLEDANQPSSSVAVMDNKESKEEGTVD